MIGEAWKGVTMFYLQGLVVASREFTMIYPRISSRGCGYRGFPSFERIDWLECNLMTRI